MSLFSKKPKQTIEEPRDDYIELGTTAQIAGGSRITLFNRVYSATFDEMAARVGCITSTREKGNAFIVQQFTTLKEYDELVEKRSNHVDK